MTAYVERWLLAFVWTLAIELPIMVAIIMPAFRTWWGPCVAAASASAITHPLLWFAFPRFGDYETWVLIAETLVVTTEAMILAGVMWRRNGWRIALGRGVTASVVGNLISTLFGLYVLMPWLNG